MSAYARRRERVLISGGAGFIGVALARALVQGGHQVLALDNLDPAVHGKPGRSTIPATGDRLRRGDVRAASAWHEALRALRPTTVVHLAAETATGQSLSQVTRHASTNVLGVACMLDALRGCEEPPAHLVLASSRAVYGEGAWRAGDHVFHPGPRSPADLAQGRWDPPSPDAGPASPLPSRADRTPARPSSVYGATKLAQEHLCTTWASGTGMAVSILRLQNVYGPGQSLINPYTGIVSLFAQLAVARRPINLYEDGRIVRDFVFIEDVVSAMRSAIERRPPGQRLVDVGSGVATPLDEVARLLAGHQGAPEPFVSGRFRVGDVRAASCELSHARDELDYRPSWGLERGLERLLAWIREAGARGSVVTPRT